MKLATAGLISVLWVTLVWAQDPHPLIGSWKARVEQTIDRGTPQKPQLENLWYQSTIVLTSMMEGEKAGKVWYVGPTFECTNDLIFVHQYKKDYIFKEVHVLTKDERKRNYSGCTGGTVKLTVIDDRQMQWEFFYPHDPNATIKAIFVPLNPLAPKQPHPLEQKGAGDEKAATPAGR